MAQGGDATSAGGTAPLPDTPDAIEIAMAAVNSGQPLPDIARTVLEKQAALLDEEARLVKRQAHELDLKIIPERVLAGLWLLLAAAVLALIGGLAWAVWRAARTDALVVEPFSMPPALVQQGMTGEVAAGRVLDQVSIMLKSRSSTRSASSYQHDWGDDLKIDIPNTGLTLDQGWKLLRRWLGRETRISGDVVQRGDQVTIVVRLGDGEPQRITGPATDIDSLLVAAGEHVLRSTQPYRYAVYISQNPARREEQRAIFQRLIEDRSPTERFWGQIGLAALEREAGNLDAGRRITMQMIADQPNWASGHRNLAYIELYLGRWGPAVQSLAQAQRTPNVPLADAAAARRARNGADANLAFLQKDLPRMMQARATLAGLSEPLPRQSRLVRFQAAMMAHDIEQAGMLASQGLADIVLGNTSVARQSLLDLVQRLEVATLANDHVAIRSLLAQVPAIAAAAQNDPLDGNLTRITASTNWRPTMARAHIALGEFDRAANELANAPADCLPCTLARAALAQARGDMATAARLHDAAVSLAPRLPQPYLERGRFLLAQRKYAAAERNFRAAEKLSNGWADPQKYLGDALAAQGRPAEARAAWAEAVRRAPKWAEAQAALKRAA